MAWPSGGSGRTAASAGQRAPGQLPNQVVVVDFAKLVTADQAAGRTSVQNLPPRLRQDHGDRLHQPLTACGPVARMNVHVLGPEAARTVIGIAVALDQATAAGADEVLDSTGEATVQINLLSPIRA
jgi:hypothetical protein